MELKSLMEEFERHFQCPHIDLEWQEFQPDRPDEPGCPEGWICRDCGDFVDCDTATKMGI